MKNRADAPIFHSRGLRRSAANLRWIPSPNIADFKALICKALKCDFAPGVSAQERFDKEEKEWEAIQRLPKQ
ncbi:MAG: hypothetical protein Q4C16_09360, partial [Eubacteriales bacterium]|nr:hypothetical protein [Eubacteriales bacterium]